MKYIFLDCFSSFSPCMLAGALLDMTKNEELMKKLCSSLPKARFSVSEEKRCGMEAAFVCLDYEIQNEIIGTDNLFDMCKRLDISINTRDRLNKYISITAEAKSIEPKNALFDAKYATDALIFSAYALETICDMKAEKVWVSRVLMPSPEVCSASQAQKNSNTMYILKKHNICPTLTTCDAPLLSEEGAALMAVLDASCKSSVTPNIIKIGYGAGEDEICEMPNILRAVYGEEGEGDMLFEAETEFGELFSNLNAMEA